MAPSTLHLPNGQHITVTPVFGGLYFKPNELTTHNSAFPPGWTIVLNEAEHPDDAIDLGPLGQEWDSDAPRLPRKSYVHRYKRPTLHNDHLFISSISLPNSSDFKPAHSPTRQIAMMLWAALWWYFHQPEPESPPVGSTQAAEDGALRREWRININREGIFKGKKLLPKLERMGLIASEESSVGTNLNEKSGVGWTRMFASRRAFWQIDARIFLFSLAPAAASPVPASSPHPSRPSSPKRDWATESSAAQDSHALDVMPKGAMTPVGPFQSTSHLPTYYPPHPPQYVVTAGVRHPLRPKPYRQGETFYIRYIPSVGQYLSFRIASMSNKPCLYNGPISTTHTLSGISSIRAVPTSMSDPIIPTLTNLGLGPTDVELLHDWMNKPRVKQAWDEAGPEEHQEKFLQKNLSSRHSFPALGCWDGKAFGYFELYWVKEDTLGRHIPHEVGDFDRGIHCLVGEEEFRGPHRVKIWLNALIHHCWLSDLRTNAVFVEPRVGNTKIEKYLYEAGFQLVKEIMLPHKKANLMKITRDAWEKPAI